MALREFAVFIHDDKASHLGFEIDEQYVGIEPDENQQGIQVVNENEEKVWLIDIILTGCSISIN